MSDDCVIDVSGIVASHEGEVWHPGDLSVFCDNCSYAELDPDLHLISVGSRDEPLIFLGFGPKSDGHRRVWFISVRFGPCWRNVWTIYRDGVSLVQSLDMNSGAFHA